MLGAAHENNALWDDNLPAHASEGDVMAVFTLQEALNYVVTRAGSCSYVFIVFCSVPESRAALEALHGSKVNSAFIWVEYTCSVTSHPYLLPH